ncbi:copper amine oxidase [Paenibacillus sp. sptzw28]|uniref:stalk domain-containing protein n=1 Tax=Paenibacillus sp. sptzw28 TaxID=715179 RepID=UPI001C6E1BA5|nr:stalk domain-containing protein [Paenibacillus sp. sptzw28]QYR20634.1 copper amine oxidase [Paenibacillus sp. sptzw28]
MYSNIRKSRFAAGILAAALLGGSMNSAAAASDAHGGTKMTGPSAYNLLQPVLPAYSTQAEDTSKTLHIVAVGDSLTVGYENGMSAQSVPYGYAERVYEQALYHGRAEMENYGVLGLKSGGLQNWLDAAERGTSVTADGVQPNLSKYPLAEDTIAKSADLRTALEQAGLVVMTIGGNDFLTLFDELKGRSMSPGEIKTWIDSMMVTYKSSLEASVRAIAAINSKTQIVFADQYLPVPKPSKLNKAVTEEQYAVLQAAIKQLRDLNESVAAEFRGQGFTVKAVDVSEPFAGKELAYTTILQGDIHPKQAGYEQIGKAFALGIWGEHREPAALSQGVPLRVIVNGKQVSGTNKPVLKNNTTYLPMRDIANALNAGLSWDGKTQTATIRANGKQVSFTIGAKSMKVNGEDVPLDTPAYLEKSGGSSVTYLPLAALSKGLGYQVVYRKPIQTVFINS